MPVFTIESVDERGSWGNDYGNFHSYKLMVLEEGQVAPFQAEWSRKVDAKTGQSRQPKVGERIEADVQQTEYGARLKNVKPADGGRSGGGGFGGAGGSGKSYEADPKKSRNVAMGESQRIAWEMARFVFEHSLVDEKREELEELYKGYVMRNYRQRLKAMEDESDAQ